jgi:HNH endonuclease
MLRQIDNAKIEHWPNFLTGRAYETLFIGSRSYRARRKTHRDEFAAAMRAQLERPHPLATIDGRTYWIFQNRFYSDNEGLNAHQVYVLITMRQQRRARQIHRAQQYVAVVDRPEDERFTRSILPEDVRQLVWERDGGRCRHCGSRHELQFDHIIPVAEGGSNEAENIEVLCGPCNRKKGASLTVG